MPKFNIITEALPLCIILWYKPVEQASIETLHIIASYFTSLELNTIHARLVAMLCIYMNTCTYHTWKKVGKKFWDD